MILLGLELTAIVVGAAVAAALCAFLTVGTLRLAERAIRWLVNAPRRT